MPRRGDIDIDIRSDARPIRRIGNEVRNVERAAVKSFENIGQTSTREIGRANQSVRTTRNEINKVSRFIDSVFVSAVLRRKIPDGFRPAIRAGERFTRQLTGGFRDLTRVGRDSARVISDEFTSRLNTATRRATSNFSRTAEEQFNRAFRGGNLQRNFDRAFGNIEQRSRRSGERIADNLGRGLRLSRVADRFSRPLQRLERSVRTSFRRVQVFGRTTSRNLARSFVSASRVMAQSYADAARHIRRSLRRIRVQVGRTTQRIRGFASRLASPYIRAFGRIRGAISSITRPISTVGRAFSRLIQTPFRLIDGLISRIRGLVFTISSIVGAIGLKRLVNEVVEAGKTAELSIVQLATLFKTTRVEAERLFFSIREFARPLPVTTEQVVSAFIRLRSVGIDPTAERMEALVDASLALGRPLENIILGVQSLETESLRKLGINLDRRGDEAILAFGDVVRRIEKNDQVIREALIDLFRERFGGALLQSLQNFQTNVAVLVSRIGDFTAEAGLRFLPRITEVIQRLLRVLNIPRVEKNLEDALNRFFGGIGDGLERLFTQARIESIVTNVSNFLGSLEDLPVRIANASIEIFRQGRRLVNYMATVFAPIYATANFLSGGAIGRAAESIQQAFAQGSSRGDLAEEQRSLRRRLEQSPGDPRLLRQQAQLEARIASATPEQAENLQRRISELTQQIEEVNKQIVQQQSASFGFADPRLFDRRDRLVSLRNQLQETYGEVVEDMESLAVQLGPAAQGIVDELEEAKRQLNNTLSGFDSISEALGRVFTGLDKQSEAIESVGSSRQRRSDETRFLLSNLPLIRDIRFDSRDLGLLNPQITGQATEDIRRLILIVENALVRGEDVFAGAIDNLNKEILKGDQAIQAFDNIVGSIKRLEAREAALQEDLKKANEKDAMGIEGELQAVRQRLAIERGQLGRQAPTAQFFVVQEVLKGIREALLIRDPVQEGSQGDMLLEGILKAAEAAVANASDPEELEVAQQQLMETQSLVASVRERGLQEGELFQLINFDKRLDDVLRNFIDNNQASAEVVEQRIDSFLTGTVGDEEGRTLQTLLLRSLDKNLLAEVTLAEKRNFLLTQVNWPLVIRLLADQQGVDLSNLEATEGMLRTLLEGLDINKRIDRSTVLMTRLQQNLNQSILGFFRGSGLEDIPTSIIDTLRDSFEQGFAESLSNSLRQTFNPFTRSIDDTFALGTQKIVSGFENFLPDLTETTTRTIQGPGPPITETETSLTGFGKALAGASAAAVTFQAAQQGAAQGILTGAASGAGLAATLSTAAIAGPVGAAIGGVVGLITSIFGRRSQPRSEISIRQHGDISRADIRRGRLSEGTGEFTPTFLGQPPREIRDLETTSRRTGAAASVYELIINRALVNALDAWRNLFRNLPSTIFDVFFDALGEFEIPAGTLDRTFRDKSGDVVRQQFQDFVEGISVALLPSLEPAITAGLEAADIGIRAEGGTAGVVARNIERIESLEGEARIEAGQEFLAQVQAWVQAAEILRGSEGIVGSINRVRNIARDFGFTEIPTMEAAMARLRDLTETATLTPEQLEDWKELRQLILDIPRQFVAQIQDSVQAIRGLSEFSNIDTTFLRRDLFNAFDTLSSFAPDFTTLEQRQDFLATERGLIQEIIAVEREKFDAEREAAQEIQQIYDEVASVAEEISDTLFDLRTGGDSVLSPARRFLEVQRRIAQLQSELPGLDDSERADTLQELAQLFQQVAGLGREFGEGSPEAQALFRFAERGLTDLKADELFSQQETRLQDIGDILEREFEVSARLQRRINDHLRRQRKLLDDQLAEFRNFARRGIPGEEDRDNQRNAKMDTQISLLTQIRDKLPGETPAPPASPMPEGQYPPLPIFPVPKRPYVPVPTDRPPLKSVVAPAPIVRVEQPPLRVVARAEVPEVRVQAPRVSVAPPEVRVAPPNLRIVARAEVPPVIVQPPAPVVTPPATVNVAAAMAEPPFLPVEDPMLEGQRLLEGQADMVEALRIAPPEEPVEPEFQRGEDLTLLTREERLTQIANGVVSGFALQLEEQRLTRAELERQTALLQEIASGERPEEDREQEDEPQRPSVIPVPVGRGTRLTTGRSETFNQFRSNVA